MVCLVDSFGKDQAGGASSGGPSEGDAERAHDERLVETLEVGIARLCVLLAFWKMAWMCVDVGELGHDGGGAERATWGPFNVKLINKL